MGALCSLSKIFYNFLKTLYEFIQPINSEIQKYYMAWVILIQKQLSKKKLLNTYYMFDSGTGEMRMEKRIPSFKGLTKIMRQTLK